MDEKGNERAGSMDPRFSAVVEASPLGMHIYRLEAGDRLIFAGANPAADRILNVSNAPFVGKTIEEAFPPLVETEVPRRYREAAAEGRPWHTEQIFYEDQQILGAYEVHAFQIAPGEMAAVFHDITERKRAEAALAQEKERLSVTLRSIGDGVISTDIRGIVTMINRVAERLTGWPVIEAVGRDIREVFRIVDPATGLPKASPVEDVIRTGGIIELEGRTILRARDGSERFIGDSGAPIRNDASQVVGAVLVFRDITEKVRMEEAEQRTQRLEALGLLAGGIAHDFNNLLSGLFGYIDLSRECCEDPRAVQSYMTSAASVLERAKGLTQQLLTFSKGGVPVRRSVDLQTLLHETTRFALTGSSVSPVFDLAPDLDEVRADSGQLAQVLDNLLINAKQAMPKGGRIAIGAVNLLEGDALRLGLRPGRYVKISIRDEGIGIPSQHLAHVFDPFFTTKAQGSGLGLAVVHSVVTKHEGRVEVESELGKGTTFQIYLPSCPHQDAAVAKDPRRWSLQGHSIYILDDEDYIREVAAAMLRRLGCEVVAGRDGAEAVAMHQQRLAQGRGFDAFLLDLTIPGGMGGRQTIEVLRALDPGVRGIASSGYSEDPIMSAPGDFGFSGSLRKPYLISELAQILQQVLEPPN